MCHCSGGCFVDQAAGFEAVLRDMVAQRVIDDLIIDEEMIYENQASAPKGHGQDRGKLITFRAI